MARGPVPASRRRGPRLAGAAAGAGAVLLAGFWLGGYPGAAILTAATGLFTAAVSRRRARRLWSELSRPRLAAGLLLAAAACGAAGERLLLGGASGPAVTVLLTTAPQVICLIVAGGLVAALVAGDP